MKKWLIGFIIILSFLVACMYIFIPSTIVFQQDLVVHANSQGFYRTFLDDSSWQKWWPEENKSDTTNTSLHRFYFNGYNYTITEKRMNGILISISDSTTSASTLLTFIATMPDTMHLIWAGHMPTSTMPLKRFQTYRRVKKLENDMSTILKKLQSFYSKPENVYGIFISKALVSDSLLIFTDAKSNGFPTTEFIYSQIDQLRKYIADQSAKETGFPMLNINTADSINYLTKVAIPVNKRLKSSGNISFRWMLGGGNILITEIKGGSASIDKAFKEMENYVSDYRRTPPAIPFQSLVTDRMKEPDTSKWITRIFYPVM